MKIFFKLAITRRAVFFSSKCTQNRLSAGLRPNPLGELTALANPLAEFKGPTSKEGEGREGCGGEALGPAPYT